MITRLFISSLFFGAIMMNSFAQKIVWKPVENMPAANRNTSSVTVDSCIYVLGGFGTSAWNSNYMYNLQTKTWEIKQNMITGRSNFAAVAVGNDIYAIGGDQWLQSNEVYNTQTNTWSGRTPMPTARQHVYGTLCNNKIHIIGGLAKGNYDTEGWEGAELLDIHEVYDPIADSWDTLAPLPEKYQNVTLSCIEGKIYAIGGQGDNSSVWNCYTSVYVYDTLLNSWDSVYNINSLPYIDNSAIIGDKVFLLAADYPDSKTSSVYCYNSALNTGELCTPLKYVCNEASFASFEDKLYIIGGATHNFVQNHSNVFEGTIIESGNFIPEVCIPLKDDSCFVDVNFSYKFSAFTFIDDDTLTFDAGLSDGSDLPDWLIFDTINRVFSGTPVEEGIIEIVITSTDNYQESVSDTFNLTVKKTPISGLKQTSDNGLLIYPNPATNRIIVEMNSDYAEFSIMNIHGQVVYHKDLTNNINYIDLYSFEDGIYFVKMISDNKIYTSKLMITCH